MIDFVIALSYLCTCVSVISTDENNCATCQDKTHNRRCESGCDDGDGIINSGGYNKF